MAGRWLLACGVRRTMTAAVPASRRLCGWERRAQEVCLVFRQLVKQQPSRPRGRSIAISHSSGRGVLSRLLLLWRVGMPRAIPAWNAMPSTTTSRARKRTGGIRAWRRPADGPLILLILRLRLTQPSPQPPPIFVQRILVAVCHSFEENPFNRPSFQRPTIVAHSTQLFTTSTSTSPSARSLTRRRTSPAHPAIMKRFAAAALAAATATAQSISYTTTYIDDCPATMSDMITVSEGVTITTCPGEDCHHETPAPQAPAGPMFTTVYTTTYLSVCETGMTPVHHVVTESGAGPMPTWTAGPHHIPDGFIVTTKVCTACEKDSMTVTVTEPCGCNAHDGTMVPADAMPTAGGMIPGDSGSMMPGDSGTMPADSTMMPGDPDMPAGTSSMMPGDSDMMPSDSDSMMPTDPDMMATDPDMMPTDPEMMPAGSSSMDPSDPATMPADSDMMPGDSAVMAAGAGDDTMMAPSMPGMAAPFPSDGMPASGAMPMPTGMTPATQFNGASSGRAAGMWLAAAVVAPVLALAL